MSADLRTEVCILGGGPGGSSVALQLAKHGVKAVLLEKSTFPRDKVCGDALSGKVMRTLERLDPSLAATVKAEAAAMPSWGVTFVAPGGRALRVPFSRNTGLGEAPGVILPRLRFDDILFQRAKSADGITVLEGTAAKSFERMSDGWLVRVREELSDVSSRLSVLQTDNRAPTTISCSLIIDASGANSHFARSVAGLPMEPKHHAAGVRAYFSGVRDLDPQGFIELIFLKDLLPGYLWVFPLPGGRANVGLGLRSDVVRTRKADLKKLLSDLVSSHPQLKDRFVDARMEGSVQGMGLPLASKRRALSGDGYLLVGDAGHLIDPFTGEGISHAMISGVYAADVAHEMLRNGSVAASEAKQYDERVWKRLGKELAISTRLQRMANQAWLFDFVVDRANNNPALADTISSMFTDMDLRERLKKPGFYMDLVLGRALKH
ncbi:MAG: geranylgeranyl reductase family protein [Flavobacteriales bacterium]|nr:geranylgeranyl reductase family protein [Flavobacteriales bacterium]